MPQSQYFRPVQSITPSIGRARASLTGGGGPDLSKLKSLLGNYKKDQVAKDLLNTPADPDPDPTRAIDPEAFTNPDLDLLNTPADPDPDLLYLPDADLSGIGDVALTYL